MEVQGKLEDSLKAFTMSDTVEIECCCEFFSFVLHWNHSQCATNGTRDDSKTMKSISVLLWVILFRTALTALALRWLSA